MNHRKSSLGRSRDFGTEGAGKGDSDRVTDNEAFGDNFSKIEWPVVAVQGFRTVGAKQVKTYGATPKKEWVINPEWVNAPLVIKFPFESDPEFPGVKFGLSPAPEREDFESWDR